jgi:predicted nuclease with TOPRIM domain
MTVWQAFFGFLGIVLAAAITGLVTYKVAKRPKEGRVTTSEAETLWAQAQEMRTELRLEVTDCKQKLEKLDEENTRLREGLIHAEEKILGQRMEILTLREHVSQLKEDLHDALKAVADQHERTSELQGDVTAVKQEMSIIQGGKP